jgi:hypothetical protein
MDKNISRIHNGLTFKTTSYGKNSGFFLKNEHIIIESSGVITLINNVIGKPPILVGEYYISTWNLKLSKTLNIDINNLINHFKGQCSYDELSNLISNNDIDLNKPNKLVIIQSLILSPQYRKKHILDELIEFIYREYGNDDTKIIILALPLQYNEMDYNYYNITHIVEIKEKVGNNSDIKYVPAKEYFQLDDLTNKTDFELNQYKLYACAQKCGFDRIGESNLFILNQSFILNKIINKNK